MLSKINSKILLKCKTSYRLRLFQTELITSLKEVLHSSFLNKLIVLFLRISIVKTVSKTIRL